MILFVVAFPANNVSDYCTSSIEIVLVFYWSHRIDSIEPVPLHIGTGHFD